MLVGDIEARGAGSVCPRVANYVYRVQIRLQAYLQNLRYHIQRCPFLVAVVANLDHIPEANSL